MEFKDLIKEASELVFPEISKDAEMFILLGDKRICKIIKNLVNIPCIISSELPKFASPKTQVFLFSNDIHDYTESRRKECPIFVATSEGAVRDACVRDNVKYLRLPKDASWVHLLIPVIRALSHLNLAPGINTQDLMRLFETSTIQERSEDLAKEIYGKIPLIYTTPSMEGVGIHWKKQYNNIAGKEAFHSVIPTNEWQSINDRNKFHIIFIQDERDSTRVKKILDTTKTFITDKGIGTTEIAVSGKEIYTRLFTLLRMGDIIGEKNGY